MNGGTMLVQQESVQTKWNRRSGELLRQMILRISIAVIVILAIPVGILGLMMRGVWHLADCILRKLEERGKTYEETNQRSM